MVEAEIRGEFGGKRREASGLIDHCQAHSVPSADVENEGGVAGFHSLPGKAVAPEELNDAVAAVAAMARTLSSLSPFLVRAADGA